MGPSSNLLTRLPRPLALIPLLLSLLGSVVFATPALAASSTVTTITADDPDPSVVGESVAVHFSVTSDDDGTPTGNVTITDGTVSCTATVAERQCSLTFTSTGNKNLVATYEGDSTFDGSTSIAEAHMVFPADTLTEITSDAPDPSVVGQSVTVQYTVSSQASTPTGNVTVSDGTDSCTASVADGECSLAFTSVGTKILTATYGGDGTFIGSSSAAEPHTVVPADTTTSITSDDPDPSLVGEPVTVEYDVSVNAPGAGAPTGDVTVSDGTISCSAPAATGHCSLTLTAAGAGSMTATYAGDADFNGSTSAAEPHQVDQASTTTAITSDGPDPSDVGQAITVQYDVAVDGPGAGTPSGTVTVSDGVDSCTGTVGAGQCSLTLTSGGARSLAATYAGDASFAGSTSAVEPHSVTGGATTTAINADDPDPSVVGQPVAVHYSVTPAGGGSPTGNVTVSDGTISCTATVVAGQCSLTFTSPGPRSLTATYVGDASFTGSTSAAEAHAVDAADTTTTITSDAPDPSVHGSPVAVHFFVTVNAPGTGTPTGTVTVSDGVDSCTGSAPAGQCTITLTTVGSRTLTATYTGDSEFNGSTSAAEMHTVDLTNSTPTATVTDGQCSSSNVAGGTIDLTLSDADGDPLTLTIASNSNPSLLPNVSVAPGDSADSRSLTVGGAAKNSGTATITLNLSDGKVIVPVVVTVKVGTSQDDMLDGTTGIDMIFGLGGKNTLSGYAGDDLLCGGNSNDTLSGGDGNDILDGENGSDTLSGDNGNDILRGSTGSDTLTGGAGADMFSGGPGSDTATDFNLVNGDTQDGTIP